MDDHLINEKLVKKQLEAKNVDWEVFIRAFANLKDGVFDNVVTMVLDVDSAEISEKNEGEQKNLGKPFKWCGLTVWMSKDYEVPTDKFWRYKTVFRESEVKAALIRNKCVISKEFFDDLYKHTKAVFYVDREKRFLLSICNSDIEEKFGPLTAVRGIDLQQFSIDDLDYAEEKTYTRL